jgi:uncharacterized membrane protein
MDGWSYVRKLMKSMRYWNYWISGFFIVFGFVLILLSRTFPIQMGTGDPGSGFWPTVLGFIIIVLSTVLLIVSRFGKSEKLSILINLSSESHSHTYAIIGMSILFCVLLYFAGFVVSLFVFCYTSMFFLGVKSRKEKILTSLIIVGSIYIIFGIILKTPLPLPIFLR